MRSSRVVQDMVSPKIFYIISYYIILYYIISYHIITKVALNALVEGGPWQGLAEEVLHHDGLEAVPDIMYKKHIYMSIYIYKYICT
jgi:hypothetical protein